MRKCFPYWAAFFFGWTLAGWLEANHVPVLLDVVVLLAAVILIASIVDYASED